MDKIRNERITETTKVGEISEKLREKTEMVWICEEK